MGQGQFSRIPQIKYYNYQYTYNDDILLTNGKHYISGRAWLDSARCHDHDKDAPFQLDLSFLSYTGCLLQTYIE